MGKCEDCNWWWMEIEDDDGYGQCRHSPPRWIARDFHPGEYPTGKYFDENGKDEDGPEHAVWPITTSHDWCGGFKPKEK